MSNFLSLRRLVNFLFMLGVCSCFYVEVAAQTLDHRIDSLLNLMTNSEKIEQLINNSFGTTPTNARLGIPGIVMNDGPHGVRTQGASAYPTGIAMAATWDKAMLEKIGRSMGEEFWTLGIHQQLGPCIDLARDPRAGRAAESGGEDPYLAGQIGAIVTKGIQSTPVLATIKHFMVESKQAYRNSCNEIYTERWLMEHYGYNFRNTVQEGAVFSIMSAYNLVNGIQAAESPLLLNTALRQRWGFPFYVVSDWGAVHNSRLAITAGTDICMGSDSYKNDLPGLISGGQVSVAVLNAAVRNVLRTKILAGMLDYYPSSAETATNTVAHRQVCLDGARKSIVLLKNENNILPLDKTKITKIAVIGPNAIKQNLNCFGSSETFPPYAVSLKTGIENKVGGSKVLYALGCDMNSTSTTGFQAAKDIAAQADVVIFAGGLDDTQEGEAYSYGNDRASGKTDLPGMQQDLINALASVNSKVIVVIQSGGVCSVHNAISSTKGLVYAFYGGQEAGNAIADVLFGDYNPAGRMPVTMPAYDGQLPTWNDDFTDDFGCGYRWFDEKGYAPEFAFGFGLSYSTFDYSNLQVSPASTVAGSPVTVSVDIINTSLRKGEEVVQLYITAPSSGLWMPKKELKGFERIALDPSEKKTVTFTITADELYYWNEANSTYKIQPGTYQVRVGGSSNNLPMIGSFEFTDASGKPDLRITQVFTMPRYPFKGEKVTFYAMVKNQGTAALTTSDKFNISYSIDNSEVASVADLSLNLAPGGATLINLNSSAWTPSSSGKSLLSASIDPTNSVGELVESNNAFSRPIEVFSKSVDPATSNLAYKKKVWVSSMESTALGGANAVDGSTSTRWSSAFSDPQSLVVDLGAIYDFTQIVINWEAAYAKAYNIATSKDSVTWTVVANLTTGHAGVETFNLTGNARYIRVTGLQRATVYGYSIYELSVYNSANQSTMPPAANAGISQVVRLPVDNAYLNGMASKDPSSKPLTYLWTQVSGPSTATLTTPTSSTTVADNMVAGTYIFKLLVDNGSESNSDLVTITVEKEFVLDVPAAEYPAISIFPNPFNDFVTVNSGERRFDILSVYDITGKLVLLKAVLGQPISERVNLTALQKGFYIMVLSGSNGRSAVKMEKL